LIYSSPIDHAAAVWCLALAKLSSTTDWALIAIFSTKNLDDFGALFLKKLTAESENHPNLQLHTTTLPDPSEGI